MKNPPQPNSILESISLAQEGNQKFFSFSFTRDNITSKQLYTANSIEIQKEFFETSLEYVGEMLEKVEDKGKEHVYTFTSGKFFKVIFCA